MTRGVLALSMVILVVYASSFWAADPFTPPENIQLIYQAIYPDPTEAAIDYKMYMQAGGKIIALLNDEFVSEGDTFEGMKVISIDSDRVILSSSTGKKRVIVIDAMQSKLQELRKMMNEGSE